MTVKITIDCMGGDHGPAVTVPAAVSFVRSHPDAQLLLVGIESAIRAQLKKCKAVDEARADCRARDRSRRHGRSGRSRAAQEKRFVDARGAEPRQGRRGADLHFRRQHRRADGRVPLRSQDARRASSARRSRSRCRASSGYTTVLDLGANVDCEPQHLLQFAEMGHALVSALEGKERPTIGLLNIGEEVIKGNETIKRAGELLRASTLNFYGNVEGNDIYKGTTDVVVCDGFVGNVALKTSEGLAQMLTDMIKEEFGRSLLDQADGARRDAGAKALQTSRRSRPNTTAPRCSACAASSSRATDRPKPTGLSGPSNAGMMPSKMACSNASCARWKKTPRPSSRRRSTPARNGATGSNPANPAEPLPHGVAAVGPTACSRASPAPRYPRRHNGSIAISIPACSARAATCRRTASRIRIWLSVSRSRASRRATNGSSPAPASMRAISPRPMRPPAISR